MNEVSKSYCPITMTLECHHAGYVFTDTLQFYDNSDVATDVSADDFTMIVKNAAGSVVETLTIGSGLEYGAESNEIVFEVSTAVTNTAGTYDFKLEWTRNGTSNPLLAIIGTIEVV